MTRLQGGCAPTFAFWGANTLRVIASLFLAVAVLTNAHARDAHYLPEASLGPYPVGYREIRTYDLTRHPVPRRIQDDTVPADARGRPFLISVWYPAAPSSGASMTFADYVHTIDRRIDLGPPSSAGAAAAEAIFVAELTGLGGNRQDATAALPRVLALPVTARRDAAPASGKFPVYLTETYISPYAVSALAETLASHGYVVVAFDSKGLSDPSHELSAFGTEVGATDFAFVYGTIADLNFADRERLAVGSTGLFVSHALAFAMRSNAVDAFVSLDGGVLSELGSSYLSASVAFDPARIDFPMLLAYTTHPAIDPARADTYRYADRLLLHFPAMREYDFWTYGALARFVPKLLGEPKGDAAAGFDAASNAVRAFLDATLKSPTPLQRLAQQLSEGDAARAGVHAVSRKPAFKAPGDLYAMRRLLAREGASAFRAHYEALAKEHAQPWKDTTLSALLATMRFIDGLDPDGTRQRAVAEVWTKSYPRSTRAAYAYASALSRWGQVAEAKKYYALALTLLEQDTDPTLTPGARQRIRSEVTAALGKS